MSNISVYVTSDLTSSERRISPQWDLQYLKSKLELITGIKPQYQTIKYYAVQASNESTTISNAKTANESDDKNTFLLAFQIAPYSRLHVIDENPNSELSELVDSDEDAEKVSGFELTEEEYAKKNNTVLQWKKDNRLGRFDPNFEKERQQRLQDNLVLSSNIKVGDRCRVINIQGQRLGTVKFVGKIAQLHPDETWVGVEFDEPVGRNSGQIDGVKYFECRHSHGSFLKPKQVEVGDFPEEPLFSDDEEL